MAVMTQDAQRPYKMNASGGLTQRVLPLAGYTNFGGGSTAHTVYKGAVVVCDVSDTDGYFRAMPLSSSVNIASGDVFGGIAVERQTVTASNTADGSKKVTVAVDGVWGFPKGSLAVTDIGPAYASDDQTVTSTSTNNLRIGNIVAVDDYAWVDITGYCGVATA
jgi:hypothetical protein